MKLLRLLKRELAADAHEWVNDRLISRQQAEQILARYGATYREGGKNRDQGYLILMSLAALMIGLGFIIVVGANWDEIPRWLRMGIVVVTVLVTNGIGYLKYKRGQTGTAGAVLLLGSLFFGAAIMLIAQIYHLGEHFPDGIFLWALGVIPVGLLLGNRAIIVVGQTLSFIWLVLEFNLGYLPIFYIVFSAGFCWFCFRIKPSVPIYLISLAGFVTFLELVLSKVLYGDSHQTQLGVAHIFFSVAVLLVLINASKIFDADRYPHHIIDYALVTRIWAFRLGVIVLFILSFMEPVKGVLVSASEVTGAIIVIGSVTLLLLVLGYLRRINQQSLDITTLVKENSLELAGGAIFCILCLMIRVIDDSHAVFIVLLVNLLLLWTGLNLLIDGMRVRSGIKFHVGLGIILALAICRYFSLIGNYWGGAAMFAFAGIVMFFAAKYWRSYLANQARSKT
jgi:uncharacterized membrane protein